MKHVITYLGPPGTGKTETLLREVERLRKSGLRLDKIGYVSFTKQAVDVALRRAGATCEEAPFFRTLHSTCFRLCGLSTAAVMKPQHYEELGRLLGIELTGNLKQRGSFEELCQGDRALAIVETARVTGQEPKKVWEDCASEDVDWLLVDVVNRSLKNYKKANFLVDYTGMLEQFLEKGTVPQLDALIVDEAQDLSPMQWKVIEKLTAGCDRLILAGDDDQALYSWAGARPRLFIELSEKGIINILGKSWRIPKKVHELALKIIQSVSFRKDKPYDPRDFIGNLDHRVSIEDVDLTEGEWLILVRNRYMVRPLIEHCLREGYFYSCFTDSPAQWESLKAAVLWEDLRGGKTVSYPDAVDLLESFISKDSYSKIKFSFFKCEKGKTTTTLEEIKRRIELTESKPWFDVLKLPVDEAEYLRAALRRKENLRKPPRIIIDTVHGSKGTERQNVVLFSDISWRTWTHVDSDEEKRVFYVGATRAREALYIVQPSTPYYFNLEL